MAARSEKAQSKWNFVRVIRAPRNNSFQFDAVILNSADLHQLCFNYLFVSRHSGPLLRGSAIFGLKRSSYRGAQWVFLTCN
jgi:hypothetical protein